jgi:hypothetical protein
MKPVFKKLPNAKVLDVSDHYAEARKYGIRGGLPVFIKLVDGDYNDRLSGTFTEGQMQRWATSV